MTSRENIPVVDMPMTTEQAVKWQQQNPNLVPKSSLTAELFHRWYDLQQQLESVKAEEMRIRKIIFGHFFPLPKEGTNNAKFFDGTVISANYPITRKVKEEVYRAYYARDEKTGKNKFEELGINTDALVKWKPELSVKAYRELTEEQLGIVDQCLEVKSGSPSVEIKPAKA